MKTRWFIDYIQAGMDMTDLADVLWEPGPQMPDYPNRMVVITPYGGTGLDTEGAIDNVSLQVRTVGFQQDFDSAEDLALAIDTSILTGSTQQFQSLHIVGTQRVGGPPSVLTRDDADRHHFVCSYIATVESGIAEPVGDRNDLVP